MNNCKHLKIKLNRQLECKKSNKLISFKDCTNCPFKEYSIKSNSTKLKTYTSKRFNLEQKRFSLFSEDASHCYFCPSTDKLTWHEIFRGRNRFNSMRYGLCLRVCWKCHKKYQDDKEFNDFWHKKGQAMFEKTYSDLKFEDIFKRNYK